MLSRLKDKYTAWQKRFSRAEHNQPHLEHRIIELRQWFTQAAAQHLIRGECRNLRRLLDKHRGQKVLQLSLVPERCPTAKSHYRQVIRLKPHGTELEPNNAVVLVEAEFEQLPFDEQSIDLVIIHHLLEYSSEPQQLLKEAARVCKHGGDIAIVAFNPISLSGMWAKLSGAFRPHTGWYRRSLMTYRIKDWLNFLDFKIESTKHICHTLPINHGSYLRLSTRFCHYLDRINFPFSSVVCLTAKKEQSGLNLLKPDWRSLVLSRTLYGARVASRGSIKTSSKKTEIQHTKR
ncbi:methyltransferase domain-containing protein [Agaribacterium sp. ZY112]|uniref:class I SAM-dependent methyltransferase n=1 Tax=Agaribacterium sp. ZY112 TaxID=3233574 RepID=UPI003523F721